MKTSQLRSLFIDYFAAKDHQVFSTDSLIPKDDPTLLFTGAGMNQFKPYFLGIKKDVKRAVSCQKCIRTADLENVGRTAYHHTFFEMLGNFSFGDYFKEEAIQYGWDFVTRELNLPSDHLWVSVYKDDQEAYDIWKKKIGIKEKRIKRFDAEDNFWPANAPKKGPNGPCGPCSEIYYGREAGKGVEIWNLVFTEFDRQEDGLLAPLPMKNIDTGLGLERLAAVMQGVESNFEIDLFQDLRSGMEKVIGAGLLKEASTRTINALLDHLRAVVFAVTDGVMPSNEGRGYVVRKLIRRSAMHLKGIGVYQPILHRVVPSVGEVMGDAYPDLRNNEASVKAIVKKEEEAIWNILETRVPEVQIKIKAIALTTKEGQMEYASQRATEKAFEYYDTHGVPKEILEEIVRENNLTFEEELFAKLMTRQRERSRMTSKIADAIFTMEKGDVLPEDQPTEFTGYKHTKDKAKILGLFDSKMSRVPRLEKGESGSVVVDKTPFYAEQGGQIGDQGVIKTTTSAAQADDTQWYSKVILHHVRVTKNELKEGDNVEMQVDEDRRNRIRKNHTATHLVHRALQKVLGAHVKQRGSLVAPDRLRFDFSHYEAVSPKKITAVEDMVNAEIKRKTVLKTEVEDAHKAIAGGAMAFFGEKYGDKVRVVSVGDFSKELCGGTHVRSTDQIGLFRITSEGSIQSGVRRIEAVTGETAFQMRDEAQKELSDISAYLNSNAQEVEKKIEDGLNQLQQHQKKLKTLFQKHLRGEMRKTIEASQEKGGARLVIRELPGVDNEILRETADWIRSQPGSFLVVLASVIQSKPQVVVALSPDLVQKGLKAGALVKEITQLMGGSGGGRPDLALGGGKANADLSAALKFAHQKSFQMLEKL